MDFDGCVEALRTAKAVVVLVGAGISTSCGIPDFRSEGGLYGLVQRLGLALGDPQELFDIEAFDADPQPFYTAAAHIWPAAGTLPSPTHRFIAALAKKRKLLRVYSQNIDGLERAAGVPKGKLVQCHGTLATARCRSCRRVAPAAAVAAGVAVGRVVACGCGGVVKPDVVFFGEPLPRLVGRALEKDRLAADLLLVIGTSLSVAPITTVLREMGPAVPQVLINRDDVVPPRSTGREGFDLRLLGDCDAVTAHLAERLGYPRLAPAPAGGLCRDAPSLYRWR